MLSPRMPLRHDGIGGGGGGGGGLRTAATMTAALLPAAAATAAATTTAALLLRGTTTAGLPAATTDARCKCTTHRRAVRRRARPRVRATETQSRRYILLCKKTISYLSIYVLERTITHARCLWRDRTLHTRDIVVRAIVHRHRPLVYYHRENPPRESVGYA